MGEETYVPVPEFYAGKSVLITGGAGYLGKVLLEKLLYSCPKVKKVFLLLRDKKEISAEERLSKIIELPIFSRLRNERPLDFEKIVVLKGDISIQNLNLQKEDLETVLKEVSVVIHSAATVTFNQPLKIALNTNLEGTRNVLNLCHLMEKLQVFVHISTAYSNTNQAIIAEKLYPPPVSVEDAYKFVEKRHNEASTIKFLNGRPNTYTFTKALAEHFISEKHGDIPAVIIRPSIVTPSKDEPVRGWVDNWFGATGFLTTLAQGVCRVVYTDDHNIVDLIPVDYVCNLTLVAAARVKREKEVTVYNSSSGSSNPITLREMTDFFTNAAVKNNFNKLPFPKATLFTRRYWMVWLIKMVTYLIAYGVDMLTRLAGNSPIYMKLVSRSFLVCESLEYFTFHTWLMESTKSEALYESMSPADAKQFPFLARDIVWSEYMDLYFEGVKKYLIEKK